jgi:hypothetical protein
VAKGLLNTMNFYHKPKTELLRKNELSKKSAAETSRLSLIGFEEKVLKLEKNVTRLHLFSNRTTNLNYITRHEYLSITRLK